MGIIKKLTSEVSDKIAAGEVVERPASVVKELVENAIDAGATVITVKIDGGGIKRIQVTDDGCGMMREDAIECFNRHATSKISKAEDLLSIYTMGFRGEALSSISAVSKVNLYTKRVQDEAGIRVVCEGGKILSVSEEGMPNGTSFVVSDIFYNVPARMKFLKRDATEASYVSDLMSRFILSHPEISFRYINNNKEVYFSAGDKNLVNCVYTVYGKDYAKSVIKTDYTYEGIKINGVLGKGDTARPNRNYQSFFVNKRYVKSALISKAVEEAYKNQIMTGKYPMAVLNIEMDAAKTDINVHPAKMEVKFSSENESKVFSAVFHAAQNALYASCSPPQIERVNKSESVFVAETVKKDAQYMLEWEKAKKSEPKQKISDLKIQSIENERHEKKEEHVNIVQNNVEKIDKIQTKVDVDNLLYPKETCLEEPKHENVWGNSQSITPFADAIERHGGVENAVKFLNDCLEQRENTVEKQADENTHFKLIGQVFSTYVIVEKDDEMLLIDQHAAHERIKFEELKKELENKQISAQDLLVPINVNLTPIEHDAFLKNAEYLKKLGFEAEDFGGNSLIVRTSPTYVDYEDVSELLIELINQIMQNKEKPVWEKSEYALYTIACKAAIKANHLMDDNELKDLVRQVFAMDNINTCPHGRPITVSMTKKEIEKEFKRII